MTSRTLVATHRDCRSLFPLSWLVLLLAFFLLGTGIALHEKLDRRRTERTAVRRLIEAHAAERALAPTGAHDEDPPG